MKDVERKIIEALLGDEVTQQIVKDMGITGTSPEDQMELITLMGKNIQDQVLLEILKALPQSEHDAFYMLMQSGSDDAVREFLLRHIPDLDEMVRHVATVEYESIKTGAQMRLQGVDR